jgi:hypothetical protein
MLVSPAARPRASLAGTNRAGIPADGPESTMPGGYGRPGCCRQSGEHEAGADIPGLQITGPRGHVRACLPVTWGC